MTFYDPKSFLSETTALAEKGKGGRNHPRAKADGTPRERGPLRTAAHGGARVPKGHAQAVGTAQADPRLSTPHPVQVTGGTFSPLKPQDGGHMAVRVLGHVNPPLPKKATPSPPQATECNCHK